MAIGSLSFRTKLFLAYCASALAALFVVFVAGNYYVNVLQKRNLADAILLAEDQARELATEVQAALLAGDDGGLGARDRVRPLTSIVLRSNDAVVWAAVIDANGNKVFEQARGRERSYEVKPLGSESYQADIPGDRPGENLKVSVESQGIVREIREPMTRDGKKVGEIRLQVAEGPTYSRMEATSRQITMALLAECLLLLAVLTGVFVILWRLFSRQIELLRKNSDLDRMAYVGTLASGLAHEIRNPLSSMSVNLQVMREELAERGENQPRHVLELAGRVDREVHQLNQMLTSFLDFALPSRDNFTEFCARGLMAELVEAHAEELSRSDIEVAWEVPDGLDTEITADRRLIHQALRNILLNGIQVLSSSVKRRLTVTVAESQGAGSLIVALQDSGPGIPAENLDKLFEAFFTTRRGGSGLGLAVSRRVVEEHGGRIWAQNNRDTMGATFFVELPRITQERP